MSNLFAYFAQLSYVLFCGYLVITENFSVGTVVACIQLSNQFVSPTLSIIDDITKLKANSEIRSRIIGMMDYHDTKDNDLSGKYNIDKVVCKNISFSYDNKVIINDFNHVFKKGKKYLIVGPSGSGKTTILNIIAGKNKNYNGSDKYYNEDKIIDDVGNSISFCEQNVFLFDDTIFNNITMFKNYSKSRLNKVIEECEINRVLGKNDLNLNSRILENGKNLSGGQKQIIAVARTLLKDASIYIFDEPTSSIDKKTSIIIHEALKRIDGILIEVTHDKSKEITTGFDEIVEVK